MQYVPGGAANSRHQIFASRKTTIEDLVWP
jgi:hypothetical protein